MQFFTENAGFCENGVFLEIKRIFGRKNVFWRSFLEEKTFF